MKYILFFILCANHHSHEQALLTLCVHAEGEAI